MKTKIVGHRGASREAPENTRAAFQLAWEQGADGVELDVRMTRDGHVVVIHDESALRTAGLEVEIASATMSKLRQLDAGSWKGMAWADERLPELGEVLAEVPPGRKVFIEIKCGVDIMAPLLGVLERCPLTVDQLGVVGFSREVMRLARQQLPVSEVLWNVELKTTSAARGWSPAIEALSQQIREAKLDGLGIGVRGHVDQAFVRRALQEGLKLFAWTVDDAGLAAELVRLGVDYLVTNRPGWMRTALAARLSSEH